MVARNEGRARQRELKQLQWLLARNGLPPEQDRRAVMAAAAMFRTMLADVEKPSRALDAAERLLGLYELSIRRHPPQQAVDCIQGCTHCCHNFASVSAPEAFLIAAWVDGTRRPAAAAAIDIEDWRQRAAATIRRSVADRFGGRIPCAFLRDGLCAIYSVRPLACRSCLSFSVDACRQSFEGMEVDIDMPVESIMLRSNANFAMLAALRSLSYPSVGYELSEAVATILDTKDALARWTGGEDILAGVQTAGPNKPSVEKALSDMAHLIIG